MFYKNIEVEIFKNKPEAQIWFWKEYNFVC